MCTKRIPNPKPTIYCALYPGLVKVAREKGYALAVHGSMLTDLDLIACAWRDDAVSANELMQALWDEMARFDMGENFHKYKNFDCEVMPGGRLSYCIPIMGDWFIDLSVYPPVKR